MRSIWNNIGEYTVGLRLREIGEGKDATRECEGKKEG